MGYTQWTTLCFGTIYGETKHQDGKKLGSVRLSWQSTLNDARTGRKRVPLFEFPHQLISCDQLDPRQSSIIWWWVKSPRSASFVPTYSPPQQFGSFGHGEYSYTANISSCSTTNIHPQSRNPFEEGRRGKLVRLRLLTLHAPKFSRTKEWTLWLSGGRTFIIQYVLVLLSALHSTDASRRCLIPSSLPRHALELSSASSSPF